MTAQDILAHLRDHTEGEAIDGWHMVYLDNARPANVSPRQFAGFLSALAKAGVYREVDGYAWGEVHIDDTTQSATEGGLT